MGIVVTMMTMTTITMKMVIVKIFIRIVAAIASPNAAMLLLAYCNLQGILLYYSQLYTTSVYYYHLGLVLQFLQIPLLLLLRLIIL